MGAGVGCLIAPVPPFYLSASLPHTARFLGAAQVVLTSGRISPPQTFLRPADFVFDERIIDRIPTLGGRPYAVHEPDENRITGVLITPPKEDPHICLRARRATMNANPDRTPPVRRVSFTDTTYVRPRRGRSASRPRA